VRKDLVTIGITCYNAADMIGRAINSALNQTYRNIEIIIVDDCSTDGSLAVINTCAAKFSNVSVVQHRHNLGPAGARNSLLRHANGEFICFFDDDDVSHEGRVCRQRTALLAYEQRTGAVNVVCCASGERYYPNGYSLELPAIGTRGLAPQGAEIAEYLLYFGRKKDRHYGGVMPACSVFGRTSTFKSLGGFDQGLRRVEDNDFAIRLALAGGHIFGIADKLFIQFATSGGDKSPERNLNAEHQVVCKNEQFLRQRGRYKYAVHWNRLRYWHFKRRYDRCLVEFLIVAMESPVVSVRHLLHSVPRRLLHEWKMRQEKYQNRVAR